MHFNFHFTAVQILWTLTFASELVLLVVLLGRERLKTFPWFTIGIAMMAVRLLASRLLSGRMPAMTLNVVFITMADLSAIVGFLVLLEMARRAFAPLKPRTFYLFGLATLLVGAFILYEWGPWPSRSTLTADSLIADLRLMQLGAQKFDMFTDLLTVQLGLLVFLYGRRYAGGWRTHVQRIVAGLFAASAAQLAVQGIWQHIASTASPHSQAEYDSIIAFRDRLFNVNGAIYVAVLVWWVYALWVDPPEAGAMVLRTTSFEPEYMRAEDEPYEEEPAAGEHEAENGE